MMIFNYLRQIVLILHAVTDAVFYRLIFADRLRCWNGCVACYAPIPAPSYQQKHQHPFQAIRDAEVAEIISCMFLSLMLGMTSCFSGSVFADGNKVDRIYHPYVQELEREFEYRLIAQNDDKDSLDKVQKHRFGFSYAPTDQVNIELYLIAEDNNRQSFKISAYELETKIQLTEQGEYWADWGLLFELEKEHSENAWEFASSVLIEKEWGLWVGAANLTLEYEWGSNTKNKIDGTLALQSRYRYSRFLEPAVEFYFSEDTLAIGPVLLGQLRLGAMKKLNWEAGIIFGLDNNTPKQTFRALLEFEF